MQQLCIMASSLVMAANVSAPPPPVGRPRVMPQDDMDELRISMHSHSSKDDNTLFSLTIPNRLLHHWHSKRNSRLYSELVNEKIEDGMVRLAIGQRDIEVRLSVLASKLAGRIRKASGRARESLLSKTSYVRVKRGETESFSTSEQELEQKLSAKTEVCTPHM